MSKRERNAVKLAKRNESMPKSLGPNPRAINKPVVSANTALATFVTKEIIVRLVGVKFI